MSDEENRRERNPEPMKPLPELPLGKKKSFATLSPTERYVVLISALVSGWQRQWRENKWEVILALIPTFVAAVYCLMAFILPPRNDVPDIIQWPEGIAPGTTTPVAEVSARHSFPSLVALYWPEILVCSVTLVCLTIYAVVVLRARVRRRLVPGGAIQITEG